MSGVFVLASCAGAGKYGVFGAACPQLTGSGDPLSMSYSANARASAKVAAFVAASKDLVELSIQMESMAAEACRRMGRDLGVPEAHMQPRSDNPGAAAEVACGALRARIDAILRDGVQIRAQATPPQCQADLQAKAQCQGRCDVAVDPGEIVAQCEPARLSGFCQGRCVGRCEGRCNGECQGQCAATDAQGRCVGACNGTCNGGCDATCHARCEGHWQAPRCEGHVRPPSADAECNASCNARASFRAQCSSAQVQVTASQSTEMVGRLLATLHANLPMLLQAEIALGKRLAGEVRTVVQVGAEMPRVIGDAGAEAAACVAAGAAATAQASARIDVSVRASASVSGRVGATSG
ncbi:MAG TPA: hypothetical protein VI072_22255 [Polyangiaceae bacterium]